MKAISGPWFVAGWLCMALAAPRAELRADEPQTHWTFQPLAEPTIPPPVAPSINEIDGFILARLQAAGLTFSPEADRATLIRRVSFDLTGLPPTPEQVAEFLSDAGPEAYERMVDHFLASEHYGERWGKHWLDAAGYADSNGYFNADSDRPLAYRYRDYVIQAINADKPFDRFVQEQLAGDQLAEYRPNMELSREQFDLLVATHFVRNSQDGTGESDGNPDEVRADKYSVLEGTLQIMGSSLLGLTLQCARCHDHKFEPITQREYYELQAVFFPAFNIEDWRKPNERIIEGASAAELAEWERSNHDLDEQGARVRAEFADWYREHRPRGQVVFEDEFAGPSIADRWSNAAPGDNHPAGEVNVQVDGEVPHSARSREGKLQIVEGPASGNRWLSTRQAFDWTPENEGDWIQATFDLVDDHVAADEPHAARIGYYLALVDYDDDGSVAGGNVLVDGNPAGKAQVHVDYPGADSHAAGELGEAGYQPGRNYGVRVTHAAGEKYLLEQIVDGIPDANSVELTAQDLPDGGFGFEFCCARSFVVDNVLIEQGAAAGPGVAANAGASQTDSDFASQLTARREELTRALAAVEARRRERPGRISAVLDRSAVAPEVHLLLRGNYGDHGPTVQPGALACLGAEEARLALPPGTNVGESTGSRLALARWLTNPAGRPAALLARVTVNRLWQQHFGTGLVATPENLGRSSARASHPELVDYLAWRLVHGGWSMKTLHRLILQSATYRQSSTWSPASAEKDPDNRLLWRRSLQRLDAESVRDAMLAVSGDLDETRGGPYVPTRREESGEVTVDPQAPGALRRSVYLQQRRTQVTSLLDVFDAPTIVTNCTRRNPSTIPLQSLSLLNSSFAVQRARSLAARLAREEADLAKRLDRAFMLAVARAPTTDEARVALAFLERQPLQYPDQADAHDRAWADFCQMLLASNAFLYLE